MLNAPWEREGGGLCRRERERERKREREGEFCHLCVTDWNWYPLLSLHTHIRFYKLSSHIGVHTHTSQPRHSRWRREEVWAALGSFQQGRCSRDWQTDRDYYSPSLSLSLWNVWILYPLYIYIYIYIYILHHVLKYCDIIQKLYHPALITCFSLLSVHLAECDKLRKDGFRSSQYYSQGPTFSDPAQSTSSLQDDEDDDIDKKVHIHINTAWKKTHRAVQAFKLTTVEFNGVSVRSSGQTQKCMFTWVASLPPPPFFFLNFTQMRLSPNTWTVKDKGH